MNPKALERYVFRAEAQLYATYGYECRQARTIARSINRVRLLHNQAGLWDFTLGMLHTSPVTVATIVPPIAVALRDCDVGYEHATEELRAYETRRMRPKGRRREDYEDAVDDDGRPLPAGAKPWGSLRSFRIYLKRLYKHAARKGRCISVTVTVPRRQDALPTNAVTWYSTEYLASGKRSHIPGDAGFEHAHYVAAALATIRAMRCSMVQRVQGRPAFVLPDGRILWLGPHYKAIEATRNQRMQYATKRNPDPLLWPSSVTRGTDVESLMTVPQHAHRLRRATGLPDIVPSMAMETGLADLAARGASPEYLAQCQGVTSDNALEDLEDLTERVLNAVAEGMHLGIGSSKQFGSAPGITLCEVCEYQQEVGALVCGNPRCLAPLPQNPGDANHRRRWELHRLIDDILYTRGETDADRERLDEDPDDGDPAGEGEPDGKGPGGVAS